MTWGPDRSVFAERKKKGSCERSTALQSRIAEEPLHRQFERDKLEDKSKSAVFSGTSSISSPSTLLPAHCRRESSQYLETVRLRRKLTLEHLHNKEISQQFHSATVRRRTSRGETTDEGLGAFFAINSPDCVEDVIRSSRWLISQLNPRLDNICMQSKSVQRRGRDTPSELREMEIPLAKSLEGRTDLGGNKQSSTRYHRLLPL